MNRRKLEMIEIALGKDLRLNWGTHIVYVPRVRHTITKTLLKERKQ